MATVIAQCPYQIDYAYSDNGKEYKGADDHALVKACKQHDIGQKFTRINRPQTNGKAEQVIRTLMDMGTTQLALETTPIAVYSLLVSLISAIPSSLIKV